MTEAYDVREVVCDDSGGNRAVVGWLEDTGVGVRKVSGAEHAGACGKLLDLVAQQGFRHLGQLELLAALRGAKSKPLGDAWAWSSQGLERGRGARCRHDARVGGRPRNSGPPDHPDQSY